MKSILHCILLFHYFALIFCLILTLFSSLFFFYLRISHPCSLSCPRKLHFTPSLSLSLSFSFPPSSHSLFISHPSVWYHQCLTLQRTNKQIVFVSFILFRSIPLPREWSSMVSGIDNITHISDNNHAEYVYMPWQLHLFISHINKNVSSIRCHKSLELSRILSVAIILIIYVENAIGMEAMLAFNSFFFWSFVIRLLLFSYIPVKTNTTTINRNLFESNVIPANRYYFLDALSYGNCHIVMGMLKQKRFPNIDTILEYGANEIS